MGWFRIIAYLDTEINKLKLLYRFRKHHVYNVCIRLIACHLLETVHSATNERKRGECQHKYCIWNTILLFNWAKWSPVLNRPFGNSSAILPVKYSRTMKYSHVIVKYSKYLVINRSHDFFWIYYLKRFKTRSFYATAFTLSALSGKRAIVDEYKKKL